MINCAVPQTSGEALATTEDPVMEKHPGAPLSINRIVRKDLEKRGLLDAVDPFHNVNVPLTSGAIDAVRDVLMSFPEDSSD